MKITPPLMILALSQYLEVSMESDVGSDIPVETEKEVEENEVKSDEVNQDDQTLSTKKRKCSGSDGHHRRSKQSKVKIKKILW